MYIYVAISHLLNNEQNEQEVRFGMHRPCDDDDEYTCICTQTYMSTYTTDVVQTFSFILTHTHTYAGRVYALRDPSNRDKMVDAPEGIEQHVFEVYSELFTDPTGE